MQRTRKQWTIDILLLAIVIAVSCIYFVLNTPPEFVNVVKTAIDDQIPRIPVFAIPYLAFLPWFWGIVLFVWYKNYSFYQLAVSIIIVNLIASVIYIMFQTYVPREAIDSSDIFSNLLSFIYSNDRAYNGFPSLHSALSAVIATYFVIKKSEWAWTAIAMAALIIISTLFTKQHFILDAVSGMSLGVITTLLSFYYVPKIIARFNNFDEK